MKALHSVRSAADRVAARLAASFQARLAATPSDAGMTTAEYAMGTVAACGFSGILYKLITSDLVMGLLKAAISRAFRISF
jgi:hypothetical protein